MFTIAISLFIVANALGQAPLFLSLIKDFDFETQRRIMARELFASFLIAIFFAFLGEYFLRTIQVETYTVGMCGGVVLFLVALGLMFPKHESEEASSLTKEPYIVPIATPLLTGPCVLTTIIVLSGQVPHFGIILGAIAIAWAMIATVLLLTPYLQFLVASEGLGALERLMGMILTILSTQMFLEGFSSYLQTMQVLP